MLRGDRTGTRELVTPAATVEIREGDSAICATVVVQYLQAGGPLRLSMPMLDALLLLNSLRAIEQELDLEEWSERVGSGLESLDELATELQLSSDEEPADPPPVRLDS
jgi:hypothetical protein